MADKTKRRHGAGVAVESFRDADLLEAGAWVRPCGLTAGIPFAEFCAVRP